MEHRDATLPGFRSRLLAEGLHRLFGELDDEVLAALMPRLEWVEVPGGEVVVRQDGTDRDLYIVMSGRLAAYDETGGRRLLNEVTRGETIGEVSFFTGSPRTATVAAIRDAVLVRLARPVLEKVLTDFPQVTLSMARLVVERLGRTGGPRRRSRPANVCLLPVTPGVDVAALGARLVAQFPPQDEALLLTAAALEARLGVPGLAQADRTQADAYGRLSTALDELESRHAVVFYVPDADPASEWSQRCLRMADRILLLADAAASPEVSAVEARYLGADGGVSAAERVLVLLHGPGTTAPRGTAAWLDRRAGTLAAHLHIRPALAADIARLARAQDDRSVGLVLCGGGARCFAQLGVYKALHESGIPVDHVGGSGMGAVMGALVAMDVPPDTLIASVREAFAANPTGDVSWLPLAALTRGQRLKAAIEDTIENLAHAGAAVEDTWKPFFGVASNFSKAAQAVLRRGDLSRAVRASCAVPGLLPPVPLDGDLMVDGSAFSHFPADVMAASGAGRIVGVLVARDASPAVAFDEVPGGATLAWDALAGSRRKYRVPSLMSVLMNATTLHSASREPAALALADLAFRLNLPSVGVLDWHAFDHAVDVGYRHAAREIAALPREALARLGAAPR